MDSLTGPKIPPSPAATDIRTRTLEISGTAADGSVVNMTLTGVTITRPDGSTVDLETRWDELISIQRAMLRMMSQVWDVELDSMDDGDGDGEG